MTGNSMARARLAALAVAGLAAAMPGGARVIERPPYEPAPEPRTPREKRTKPGLRSNEKRRPSKRAQKKHKAAIAYASKRRNRRAP